MANTWEMERDRLISRVCPFCGECTPQPEFVCQLPVLRCSKDGLLLIDPSKNDEGRVTPITEESLMALKELYALTTAARKPDFMGPIN